MQDQKSIEFFFSLGLIGMMALSIGVVTILHFHRRKIIKVEYEKQMEILKSAVKAEESHKEKIARNLHDDIISKLSTVTISLDKTLKDFKKEKFDFARFENDISNLDDIIMEVRGISYDLIPPVLSRLGLTQAINHSIDQIRETESSIANFVDKTDGRALSFSQIDQLSIYRIYLELLNNLIKHSKYEFLNVTIENDDKKLIIEFQHDGRGLTNDDIARQAQTSKGLGLSSISSRVILLNASINYFIIDNLFYILVEIPYSK